MKKLVFIVLCFSVISVVFCKDNSTDSKNSKKSDNKGPGFIARLLDKVVSTITSVVTAPLKLTWSSSLGLILTPLALPLKLISNAAEEVQEIVEGFVFDVQQAMKRADEDLDGPKNKTDSNDQSGSKDKNSSDNKSESSKSNSGSDNKSGKSESKSRRRRAMEPYSRLNRHKRGTIENALSTFNIFSTAKKMFHKFYDLFTELLHQTDNIGNMIEKLLDKILFLLKYVKPVYLYIRDELLPNTVEQLIKAERSPFATKKIIHRIDNIKEGYKVLELLGYVPSLTTD